MDIPELVKYVDLFGTRCSFYNDKMPKLYTVTGGIFSIISILVCIFIFIIFSLDDLKRTNPITTISSIPSEGYRKIKFGEEKIWIPWRIIDYNNKFVNHTNILFPVIYYYSGIKDIETNNYNITKKLLKYRLCNETSMANKSNIYQIKVPLNEIYCIDMDDLEMGGSWITEYINYIQFDLYFCEEGISYNQSNPKCTSFDKIKNFTGNNNSLHMEISYPIVQFQPTNKKTPIIVIYRQYFYHLSRYSSKIERLYLQENVLEDDLGWVLKKESNNSYWGLSGKQGDSYFIGKDNDLMNEGSNSRAYSMNIYLEPGIIHYKRFYKKLYTIFSDFFPVAYIVFVIMKIISKMFKKAENNKKMVELLFENLKEKKNIFEESLQKLRIQNNFNFNNKRGRLSYINLINKSNFEFAKVKGRHKYSVDYQVTKDKIKVRRSSIALNKDLCLNNENSNNINNNNNLNLNKPKKAIPKNKKNFTNNTTKQLLMPGDYNNSNSKNNNNLLKLNITHNINSSNNINYSLLHIKKQFIKDKLFPYKYYLCSVFIKNLDISKKNCLFSSQFSKIYIFLCQLFDITTYLSLQKEFNSLKKIFNEKSINLIEKNKKININSNNFIKDINDCIGEHKFHILAQGFKN